MSVGGRGRWIGDVIAAGQMWTEKVYVAVSEGYDDERRKRRDTYAGHKRSIHVDGTSSATLLTSTRPATLLEAQAFRVSHTVRRCVERVAIALTPERKFGTGDGGKTPKGDVV